MYERAQVEHATCLIKQIVGLLREKRISQSFFLLARKCRPPHKASKMKPSAGANLPRCARSALTPRHPNRAGEGWALQYGRRRRDGAGKAGPVAFLCGVEKERRSGSSTAPSAGDHPVSASTASRRRPPWPWRPPGPASPPSSPPPHSAFTLSSSPLGTS